MRLGLLCLFVCLAVSFASKPSNHPYSKNDLNTKHHSLRLVEDGKDDLEDAVRLWLQMHRLGPVHLRSDNHVKSLSPNAINKLVKYGIGGYLEYEVEVDDNETQSKEHKDTVSNKKNTYEHQNKEIDSIEDEDENFEDISNNAIHHPFNDFNHYTTEKQIKHTITHTSDNNDDDKDVDIKIIYFTTPKPGKKQNLSDYMANEYFKLISSKKYDTEKFYDHKNENNEYSCEGDCKGKREKLLGENIKIHFDNMNPSWRDDLRGKKKRCKDRSMRQCVGDEDDDEIDKKKDVEKESEKEKEEEKEKEKEHDKYADFYSNNPKVTEEPTWHDDFLRTGIQNCKPGSLSLTDAMPKSSCTVCFCDMKGEVVCKIDEICAKMSVRTGTELPPFCDHQMCFRQCLLTKMRAGACRENVCTCL